MSKSKYKIFIAIIVLFCIVSGIYIYKTHYSPKEVEKFTGITLWYVENEESTVNFAKIADTYNKVDYENKQSVTVNAKSFDSFESLYEALGKVKDGEGPDMIACDANDAAILKNDSATIALSKYFDEWNNAGANDAFLKCATFGNSLIGLPYAADVDVMLVNTDFVSDIEKIESFEMLCDAAKEFYKNNESPMLSISDYARFFKTAMAQLGEDFVAISPRDTESENCKYIYKLLAQTAFDRGICSSYDPIGDVIDGSIPCTIVSSAEIMNRAKDMKSNIKVYACPPMENGSNISVPYVETVCICETNTNRENASAEFLKWFISDEVNVKFVSGSGYIPVTDTLNNTSSKHHVYDSLKKAMSDIELKAQAPNLAYVENYDEFVYIMELVMESLS